jgi:hypothetical protein
VNEKKLDNSADRVVCLNNMQQREKLTSLLDRLQTDRFYGRVEIALEAGKVVLVRQTQTWKLDDL